MPCCMMQQQQSISFVSGSKQRRGPSACNDRLTLQETSSLAQHLHVLLLQTPHNSQGVPTQEVV